MSLIDNSAARDLPAPPPAPPGRAAWAVRARQRLEDYHRLRELGLLPQNGDFFPSVHYPPITMYPPLGPEELFTSYSPPADGLIDVYAHLPFCHRRCVFCHYPVKLGEQDQEKDIYLAAMETEMDLYLRQLGLARFQPRTILVGGGTPTLLTPPQLRRFLEFFVKRLDLAKCRQFNYDVDPTTITGLEGRERLKLMRDFGVDRLTIGVQSLNDQVLRRMNRDHDARRALDSIVEARQMGFKVNIEFIFGFPAQTLDNWIAVMEQAVQTGVEEIQLYRLKIEAYGDYQGGIKNINQSQPGAVPATEEGLLMKQMAVECLRAHGYHENLRRVFSRKRSDFSLYAHNQCCELYDQVGLGLTAFSSLRDRFGLNTQSFEEYYQLIGSGRLPLNRGSIRDRDEQIRWSIILPLKNREVRRKRFQETTGVSLQEVFRAKIDRLKAFGLVREDERVLELTELGAFFADEVCHQFQSPKYMAFPRSAYAEGPLNPHEDCDP